MKRYFFICIILILAITSTYANPFRLSGDFRPTKIKIYWSESDEARNETVYEYNKTGQLIKSSILRGSDSPDWYDTYEYDAKGNLIRKTSFTSAEMNYYTTYIYIENRLYEVTEYSKEDAITCQTRYEYEPDGRLFSVSVKSAPYNEKNLLWSSLEIYRYNNQKRISERLYYSEGTLSSKTVYEYKKDSMVLTNAWFGENRESASRIVTEYKYVTKPKQKERLESLSQKSSYVYEGKTEVDCCVTYTMKTEYNAAGNMTVLSFYNCENGFSGKAVIEWEKGKMDMNLLLEIFERIHWNFTGC